MQNAKAHMGGRLSFSPAAETVKRTPHSIPESALIQTKLTVGEPGDMYEKEADAMADTVMRMPEPGTVQRKCAECEKEEKEKLQMKPFAGNITRISRKESGGSGNTANSDVESGINHTRGSGSKLPEGTRSFMESRFGADFSGINIHTRSESVQMNRELNAQAFTVGNDIHFSQGKYNPSSDSGKHLLAHELTHTIQQKPFIGNMNETGNGTSTGESTIQRMALGAGAPPQRFAQFNGRQVPAGETARVNEAIGKVREVVNDPDGYSRCHGYFQTECPTQGRNSLPQMFNNAVLWRADKPNSQAFTWPNTNDLAYTQAGFDSGAHSLARTLVHELLHDCGITGNDHHLADVAGLYCIGAQNEFTIAGGAGFNMDMGYALYSYRRFLAGIANGQIQLTAGADLNLLSTAFIADPSLTGEIGSIMFGLRGRLPALWGGERFGGFTGRLEVGPDLGMFRVRSVEEGVETERTEFGAGAVVQAGLGAEFYVPIGVDAVPFSLEATYRLIQPLNSEAEMMHGLLLQAGLQF